MHRSVLASLLLASVALAAEPVAITPGDLTHAKPWGALEGRSVVLARAKCAGVFGEELEVTGLPRGHLVVVDDRLQAELARWRGRTNARIAGIARDRGRRVVLVTAVTKLPDDAALLEERARGLSPRDRLELASEALRRDPDEELARAARALFARALAGAMEASTSSGAVALARRAKTLGMTGAAIAPLASHAGTERVLEEELGAVRHRGRWVTRDEQRRALGFVRSPAGWVRPERAALERAIAEHVPPVAPRPFTNPQYEDAARARRLLAGMLKQEVARAAAFPARVERAVRDGVTWDAWVLEDGRAFVFRDGLLVAAR